MEVEEVVKSGSLFVPTQGFLRQKKSWQKKYYVLYNSSRQGIQRLEMFDNEDQYLKQNNCTRIIPLTDCLKVTPSPQKQQANVFEIRTKDTTYLFSSDSFNEMTEWLNCLQSVAFGTQSRSSKGHPLDSNANQFKSNALNNLSEFQSEDNLLYSSVDSPDMYRVRMVDTETSLRCGLRSGFDSDYTLIITSANISLVDKAKVVLTWPLRHIRRYGCTKDGFSLEAGRKCTSGEGLFSFITKDGNFIFQAVAAHVNTLKASNNLNDNQIPLNISNISPKVKQKEFNLSHSNQDITPVSSSSPPLSSSYSSKLNYLATNSSLLPTTKIPDSSKRHSIQPPKSPQMIPKKALTRLPSANTNSMIISPDAKPKASPPIPKPPRKSKESKVSDSEEPVFASREEVIGIGWKSGSSERSLNLNEPNDEVLYDEPSDLIEHRKSTKEDEPIKSPFCPSPPPVNHTVSKLTSVLKMMFIERKPNSVHPNHRDNRVSNRNSSGTPPISQSPPNNQTQSKRNAITSFADDSSDSYDFGYSQVNHHNNSDNTSQTRSEDKSSHYSKILIDDNDDSEHEYANVIHKDGKVYRNNNHKSDQKEPKESQTEHYVQNECEYARVKKRPNFPVNNLS